MNILNKIFSAGAYTLTFLIVSTILIIFIDAGSINFTVESKWTDLLQLVLITVIGAYFGGRSMEKIGKIKGKKDKKDKK